MDRVIPPFYACYLLRSTVRHQNLYVGSTPNPVRRLKQHNGLAKGGAVRTSRDTLRPWEMTCLVTGFPSKIAALQFEWAWQNTHMTRHIAVEERITQTNQRTRTSPKTGKIRRRVGRPKVSLTDKLANLHILLRAKSFERWPLEVKFFAPDVFKFWERCTAKVAEKIRNGIKIGMDESILAQDSTQPMGIHALDVTFKPMKSIIEKSRTLLAGPNGTCALCRQSLDPETSMVLVCNAERCNSASHLDCLSKHFLGSKDQSDIILPTEGDCPTCKTQLRWTDLVQDLSLRVRGEKEVAALFKVRKSRKKASTELEAVAIDEGASEDDLTELETDAELDDFELVGPDGLQDVDELNPPLEEEEEEWRNIDEVLSHPLEDARKFSSTSKHSTRVNSKRPQKEIVIEDSDWDEAELIE